MVPVPGKCYWKREKIRNILSQVSPKNFRTYSCLCFLIPSLWKWQPSNLGPLSVKVVSGKCYWKREKIRNVFSQKFPKDFLGFILGVLLSSDDFTEDRNDEKLIERFPDEPYYSLFDFHFLL